MIKNIKLKNFKSFSNLDIEMRPITLFVGPNNSGKSSVLSSIRLLCQTAESNDPSVRLLLNGIMGDFGTYKDLVYQNTTKKHLEMSLVIDTKKPVEISLLDVPDTVSIDLKYKYRASLKEIVLKELKMCGDGELIINSEYVEESERLVPRQIGRVKIPSTRVSSLARVAEVRNFLPRNTMFGVRNDIDPGKLGYKADELEATLRTMARSSSVIQRSLQRIEYLGAMRMPPSRTYSYAGERRIRVGSSGEFAMTILAMDSMRKGNKAKNIRKRVIEWLTSAGIASDLAVRPLSDRYYELHVQHPITKEYENFADVGYGNSQVIPVLIGGYNLRPGDVYLVEEPEIHLHPKAQAELGDFFVDLFESGVQSIIETHSEHMILRLQQHVVSGRISPKNIAVYYINPTENGKIPVLLELDNLGKFLSPWPGGFFPERLHEATQLAVLRSKSNK